MSAAILETQELYKFYGTAGGKVAVVRKLSMSVSKGRFVTVMGPSGSGKSTLLHMVSGLEPPSGGTVRLGGHDLYALSEKRRTLLRRDLVGFVFQFYNLIPNLTVEQNIRLPLLIGAGQAREPALAGSPSGAGGPPSAAAGVTAGAAAGAALGDSADAVGQLVDFLKLQGKLAQYPHQLSGGEMQRVSIARALVSRPAVVMADEPTGNISSSAGEEVMRLFRRSCDELGQTILLVTHNARDAAWSDEVHFLKDGELHPGSGLADAAVTPDNIAASLATLGI
jgi:putative ABC transport system ATP-binding protein